MKKAPNKPRSSEIGDVLQHVGADPNPFVQPPPLAKVIIDVKQNKFGSWFVQFITVQFSDGEIVGGYKARGKYIVRSSMNEMTLWLSHELVAHVDIKTHAVVQKILMGLEK